MRYFIHTALILLTCKAISSLKCFQCSSGRDKGCWKYNLDGGYLKDCGVNSSRSMPVCRVLSQVQYFTPGQDVTVIRECAYSYELPLRCVQSKFSGIHYSLSCECQESGCNRADIAFQYWKLLFTMVLSTYCSVNSMEIY